MKISISSEIVPISIVAKSFQAGEDAIYCIQQIEAQEAKLADHPLANAVIMMAQASKERFEESQSLKKGSSRRNAAENDWAMAQGALLEVLENVTGVDCDPLSAKTLGGV